MEYTQFIMLVVLWNCSNFAVGMATIIIVPKDKTDQHGLTQLRQVIIPKKAIQSKARISAVCAEIIASNQNSVKNMGDMIAANQQGFSASQSEKLSHIEERLKTFSLENEQTLGNIRRAMEQSLANIREDNNKQLSGCGRPSMKSSRKRWRTR